MTIKILSTKDVHTNGIKLVLYGASGSGKTRLGASAPNPIFISAEKGLLSLASVDIPYIEVSSMKTLNEAYQHVVKSEYNTIVIDSLSEVTQVVLDQTKKTMIGDSSDHFFFSTVKVQCVFPANGVSLKRRNMTSSVEKR